jgi:hypothetical protein
MMDLPKTLRKIRLELAREPGRPQGSAQDGYEFLVPLQPDGRIDAEAWSANADRCRVRRFRTREADQIGRLARDPDGQWFFDYDAETDEDDEPGFRFGDEQFVIGEYVSIEDSGRMHTYRVVAVDPI